MKKEKRSKLRKEKRIVYMTISIFIISLILLVFSLWLWISKPLEVEKLDVKFIIGKNIGVNLNSSELNFGKITPGSSATRNVIIENRYKEPLKISVFANREISNFLTTSFNPIILPGEKKKIPFTLIAPKNAPFGNYSGKIKFEFRKWKKET